MGAMTSETTWENPDFRCSVCLAVFDADEHSTSTPTIVCDNLHTVCCACAKKTSARGSNCPICRLPCKAQSDMQINRFVCSFVSKLKIKCGACNSEALLDHQEICRHAQECPSARVMCPFPDTVSSDCSCGRMMPSSSLFEHCKNTHASEIHVLEGVLLRQDANKLYSASLSLRVAVNGLQNIFVTFSGDFATLNMCLHMYSVVDSDGRDSFCMATRRFFSEQSARVDRIIYSMECGEISGLVMQSQQVLPPQEKLDHGDFDQLDAVVRFPKPLLRKLCGQEEGDLTFSIAVQFDLLVFD